MMRLRPDEDKKGKTGVERVVAAVREGLFGIAFVMSKRLAPLSMRLALLLAAIDLIQLLSFPLATHPGFPWQNNSVVQPFAAAIGYITTDRQDEVFSPSVFKGVLISSTIWVFCYCSLAMWVGYNFSNELPQNELALRLLRAVSRFSTTVLFLPLSSVMFRSFACPNGTNIWMETGWRCGGAEHIIICIVEGVLLLVFSLLAVFVTATFLDRSPTSTSWAARVHGRTDVAMLILKLLLGFVYNVLGDELIGTGLVTGLLIFCGCVWVYLWSSSLAATQVVMSAVNVGAGAAFTWCSIILALVMLFERESGNLALLLGTPTAFALCYILTLWRAHNIATSPLERLTSIAHVTVWARNHLAQYRLHADLAQTHSRHANLDEHRAGGRRASLSAAVDRTAAREGEGVFPLDPEEVERLVPQSAEEKADYHLQRATQAYDRLVTTFGHHELALALAAGFFEVLNPYNFPELHALSRMKQMSPGIDLQFIVYRRTKEMREVGKRGAKLSSIDRVIFEQHWKRVNDLDAHSIKSLMSVWATLAKRRRPDLSAMRRAVVGLQTSYREMENLYEQMLRINQDSTQVVRAYAEFLGTRLNEAAKSAELLNRADRIDEVHSRQRRKPLRHVVYGSTSDMPVDASAESEPSLTVSFAEDSIGEVVAISPAACLAFGLNPQQIVGQPLASLLPPPIQAVATDAYLGSILRRKSEPNLLNQTRLEFGLHRAGYMFPIWMRLIEAPPDARSSAARLTVALQLVTTDEEHILFSGKGSNFRIFAASAGSQHLLGIDGTRLQREEDAPVSMLQFFPTINPSFDAGTRIALSSGQSEAMKRVPSLAELLRGSDGRESPPETERLRRGALISKKSFNSLKAVAGRARRVSIQDEADDPPQRALLDAMREAVFTQEDGTLLVPLSDLLGCQDSSIIPVQAGMTVLDGDDGEALAPTSRRGAADDDGSSSDSSVSPQAVSRFNSWPTLNDQPQLQDVIVGSVQRVWTGHGAHETDELFLLRWQPLSQNQVREPEVRAVKINTIVATIIAILMGTVAILWARRSGTRVALMSESCRQSATRSMAMHEALLRVSTIASINAKTEEDGGHGGRRLHGDAPVNETELRLSLSSWTELFVDDHRELALRRISDGGASAFDTVPMLPMVEMEPLERQHPALLNESHYDVERLTQLSLASRGVLQRQLIAISALPTDEERASALQLLAADPANGIQRATLVSANELGSWMASALHRIAGMPFERFSVESEDVLAVLTNGQVLSAAFMDSTILRTHALMAKFPDMKRRQLAVGLAAVAVVVVMSTVVNIVYISRLAVRTRLLLQLLLLVPRRVARRLRQSAQSELQQLLSKKREGEGESAVISSDIGGPAPFFAGQLSDTASWLEDSPLPSPRVLPDRSSRTTTSRRSKASSLLPPWWQRCLCGRSILDNIVRRHSDSAHWVASASFFLSLPFVMVGVYLVFLTVYMSSVDRRLAHDSERLVLFAIGERLVVAFTAAVTAAVDSLVHVPELVVQASAIGKELQSVINWTVHGGSVHLEGVRTDLSFELPRLERDQGSYDALMVNACGQLDRELYHACAAVDGGALTQGIHRGVIQLHNFGTQALAGLTSDTITDMSDPEALATLGALDPEVSGLLHSMRALAMPWLALLAHKASHAAMDHILLTLSWRSWVYTVATVAFGVLTVLYVLTTSLHRVERLAIPLRASRALLAALPPEVVNSIPYLSKVIGTMASSKRLWADPRTVILHELEDREKRRRLVVQSVEAFRSSRGLHGRVAAASGTAASQQTAVSTSSATFGSKRGRGPRRTITGLPVDSGGSELSGSAKSGSNGSPVPGEALSNRRSSAHGRLVVADEVL